MTETPMLAVMALAATVGQLTVVPEGAASYPVDQALAVLKEPPLASAANDARLFRFIWIPPFPSMRMFVVRVEDGDAGAKMVAKSARWTYDALLNRTGHVEDAVERPLSARVWEELADLRQEGFWKFHPEGFPQPLTDGSVWVLEGAAWGERLRVVQHVPGSNPFKALCRRMLSLFNPELTDMEASLARE